MNLKGPRTSDGLGCLLSRILGYLQFNGNMTTETQKINYSEKRSCRLEVRDLDMPILKHCRCAKPEKQKVTKDADGESGYLRTRGACG